MKTYDGMQIKQESPTDYQRGFRGLLGSVKLYKLGLDPVQVAGLVDRWEGRVLQNLPEFCG